MSDPGEILLKGNWCLIEDKGVVSGWVFPPAPRCREHVISSFCYGNGPSCRSQTLTYRICCTELFLENSWKQKPCILSVKPPGRV